ncbi:hypothetical protein OC845_006381 [Tilletia horrida]|nr:hypothetical protein OC845_006381 [Tilletia horrida]
MCSFTNAYRHSQINKDTAGKASTFIQDYEHESRERFGIGSARAINARITVNVGSKVTSLAALMGSMSFLPFLVLSEKFGSENSIRTLTRPTLACLSFLLRGGRPNLAGLSNAERVEAEAGLFGVSVVLPFALRWYLSSAVSAFDLGPANARGKRREPQASDPVRRKLLYVAETFDESAEQQHPQPAVPRLDKNGKPLNPMEFGIMSGYAAKRRPVTLPGPLDAAD